MRFGLMTILLGIFLFAIGPIASPAATNEPVDLTQEERKWISEHPIVRVGVTPEWAPFSYFTPDGKVAGIDIDILNLISKRTGLKFAILRADSWEETLSLAKTGKLDLATGIAITPEREKLFHFTKPYYRSAVVIVARENDRRFSHVSLLRDVIIAMPRKHVTTLALKERLPSVRMILSDSQSECFEMVAHKKADATVVNVFIAVRYLNDHPKVKLGIAGVIPEFEFPLRLGVRHDFTPLPEILDKALGSISQQELDDIASQHLRFGLQGAERTALLRKRIMQILLGAAAVGSLLALWNYYLCREVRARRKAETELRQINHSMEVFSNSISHDLKAPLRAISGFAEVLKQDYGEKLGSDGNVYIDQITAAATRMNILMRDVLAYSHVSRREVSLSMVSLQDMVRQLIDEFRVEQRGYFEIVSELPEVPANPTLLSQCIANLLSNAIKFVPKERTPKIRIGGEKEGSFVKFWVEDNGIGIAPENQERIFQVFERVQTQGYEGTGIGLAIVAKGVERMEGSVGVESELGKGSRFWIQLPASNPKVADSYSSSI